ncbi:MAG TPA: coproporphyrinogen III oxidase, partial [Gammaproteobacteria bacterium]|nr:coproporphyrinogen III oxidase [Gammaproteobacteria bacterium]
VELSADRLEIRRDGRPLTRMIAQCFDAYDVANNAHSSAI